MHPSDDVKPAKQLNQVCIINKLRDLFPL